VRKRVSAPGKSVVAALPCAWEIAGETMWQPVPDLPLAFDPSGHGLRRHGSRTWVRRRAAAVLIRCVCRKLDSAILMVKAAKDRFRDDGAEALNRAMERGVLVQRSMGPRHIIIGGISA
jgi:hypothetical protein